MNTDHTANAPITSILGPLLSRLTLDERSAALRDVAATLKSEDDLVVAAWLLAADADAEQHDTVLEKDVWKFLVLLKDGGHAPAVARLCHQSTKAREWLLDSTTTELSKALSAILPSSVSEAPLDLAHEPLAQDDPASASSFHQAHSEHLEQVRATALVHLHFLLHLFEYVSGPSSLEPTISLLDVLLTALAATDTIISRAARNVCSAWLRSPALQHTALAGEVLNNQLTVHDTLWAWIKSLLKSSTQTTQMTTGYFLWSRLLELPANVNLLQLLLADNHYWIDLQTAMADGDMELKRLGVSILRRSVNLAAANNVVVKCNYFFMTEFHQEKAIITSDFEKLCTVYETVALGRYLNQVKDCLPSLGQLADSPAIVSPSWIYTILRPSMSNKMQDSIRNLLGDWIMSRCVYRESDLEAFKSLLHDSVLPWAAQGSLFTASIRGSRQTCSCDHGEKLTAFVIGIATAQVSSDQRAAIDFCFEVVLDFLERTKHNTSIYAITYLVYGLFRASSSGPLPKLTTHGLLTLADLPSTPGLSESVQDFITVMCYAMLRRICAEHWIDSGADNSMLENRLSNLGAKLTSIRATNGFSPMSNSNEWSSIEEGYDTIKSSHHRCLSGENLGEICQMLPSILGTDSITPSDPKIIIEVLDAIWDEVEIQDYPKNTLVCLPAIWLSPVCVREGQANHDLADRLRSFIGTFNKLARGRIYVWSPLLVALRKAVITYPYLLAAADIVGFVLANANQMPSARAEFHLEAAVVHLSTRLSPDYAHLTYEHYFGHLESLGFAAFFDMVNRLQSLDIIVSEQILESIMKPWLEQKLPAPIVNKWKTTEQLQIMLILLEKNVMSQSLQTAEKLLNDLLHLLKAEPFPRYRFLLELMIASLLSKQTQLTHVLFEALSTNDHHGNPKYIASMIRLTIFVICSRVGTEQMAVNFTERVLALTSSSKIIIRHEAQWSFPIFWAHAERRGWQSVVQNPSLLGLINYIRSLDKQQHFLPERENNKFDLDSMFTLDNVLFGQFWNLEPAAAPLLDREDFAKLYKMDGDLRPAAADAIAAPSLVLGPPSPAQHGVDPVPRIANSDETTVPSTNPAVLQTKGTSYLSRSVSDFKTVRQESGLMVVGSLVDNPYNLGGISRVSEIFGAGTLYISSLNVLTNRDFESVAVSSHTHMNVEALKVPDMLAFFGEKRLEGFTIVGIEQTDRSFILGSESTKLPKKTILVLGAEKEGMPAEVLTECDMLVEIPQKGYTRSMNVQTAAACVLYEYCRQHS
ncbi:hypothetical protein ANO11243_086920 [Dothideomycetidae sp. 11243]|nr:hypothetical protein ANO11243_086920 [fungal sp. No.11243]